MVEGLKETRSDVDASAGLGERRKLQRLRSRDGMVASSAGELELLNISPTGIAVRGRRRRLTIGERYLFVVRDRGQSFEMAGEVRWLIPWSSSEAIAGIAHLEILRADSGGMWGGVTPYERPPTDTDEQLE